MEHEHKSQNQKGRWHVMPGHTVYLCPCGPWPVVTQGLPAQAQEADSRGPHSSSSALSSMMLFKCSKSLTVFPSN